MNKNETATGADDKNSIILTDFSEIGLSARQVFAAEGAGVFAAFFAEPDGLSAEFDRDIWETLPEERREKISRAPSEAKKKERLAAYLCLVRAVFAFTGQREIPRFTDETCTRLTSGLYANLSHTEGGVFAAVSRLPVGVDVQKTVAPSNGMAARVLTEEERERVARSNRPAAEFTRLWARKESYMKMQGRGVAADLRFSTEAARILEGEVGDCRYALCLGEEK